jgi:hypothetical protein
VGYLKAVLSVIAGFTLALIGPSLAIILKGITTEKATGFAIVFGGFAESLSSFRFWALAFLFSALLWASGRVNGKTLRVVLFWTPVLLVIVVGSAFLILYACVRFFLANR